MLSLLDATNVAASTTREAMQSAKGTYVLAIYYDYLSITYSCKLTSMEAILLDEKLAYVTILHDALGSVETKDCDIVLYYHVPKGDRQCSLIDYATFPEKLRPVLYIDFLSLSRRRYARQLRRKVIDLINSINSSFNVKVTATCYSAVCNSQPGDLSSFVSGCHIVRKREGETTIVHVNEV